MLQHAAIAEEHSRLFCELLSLVIKKLRYDESYNFESEVGVKHLGVVLTVDVTRCIVL